MFRIEEYLAKEKKKLKNHFFFKCKTEKHNKILKKIKKIKKKKKETTVVRISHIEHLQRCFLLLKYKEGYLNFPETVQFINFLG